MGTVKALLVFMRGYRYAMRIALPKASALVQAESSSGILAGGWHRMLRQPEYELWRRRRSKDSEERTYIRRFLRERCLGNTEGKTQGTTKGKTNRKRKKEATDKTKRTQKERQREPQLRRQRVFNNPFNSTFLANSNNFASEGKSHQPCLAGAHLSRCSGC